MNIEYKPPPKLKSRLPAWALFFFMIIFLTSSHSVTAKNKIKYLYNIDNNIIYFIDEFSYSKTSSLKSCYVLNEYLLSVHMTLAVLRNELYNNDILLNHIDSFPLKKNRILEFIDTNDSAVEHYIYLLKKMALF